jgi:hypothetical protein
MRKSPVEIVATAGTRAAGVSGLRAGRFGRWADGVTAMREDCAAFAHYWHGHNERVAGRTGPLWVVLGDSTAQGLGAPSPSGGYVGQVLAGLRDRTGKPWQVLNLSKSGSVLGDVIRTQLPRVPSDADLITCGAGCRWRGYRTSSPRRGGASSPGTASTRARMATGTGAGRC